MPSAGLLLKNLSILASVRMLQRASASSSSLSGESSPVGRSGTKTIRNETFSAYSLIASGSSRRTSRRRGGSTVLLYKRNSTLVLSTQANATFGPIQVIFLSPFGPISRPHLGSKNVYWTPWDSSTDQCETYRDFCHVIFWSRQALPLHSPPWTVHSFSIYDSRR